MSYLLFAANSGTRSSFFIRFMLLPIIRSVLSNMYEMEKILEKTEDINWTVVRPPGLQNTPVTGGLVKINCFHFIVQCILV